jgi:hypothetical protein
MNIAAPIYLVPPPLRTAVDSQISERAKRIQLIRLCEIQLWGAILLSRLAVPFGAGKQLQATWMFGCVCFLMIGFRTNWAVSGRRMAGLASIGVVTVFESFYIHRAFSLLSLVYLFGIYAPVCLALPSLKAEDLRAIWGSFIRLVSILAIGGLVQLFLELIVRGRFLDPLALLPQMFQLSNYAIHHPVSIGPLTLVKPNGIFALEPSFFSQFAALGLIGELNYFRRPRMIALLAAALVASFSGTGIIVLLFGIPFLKQSAKWILGILLAIFLWSLAFGDAAIDFYTSRLYELNERGTSGNARFIRPYQMMWDGWQRSSRDAAFGIGAGQSANLDRVFEANFAPVAKVGVEFGLVGLIAFGLYWAGMYVTPAIPLPIGAALFAFYFVASGALLHPPTVFPLWTLTLGFISKNPRSRSS